VPSDIPSRLREVRARIGEAAARVGRQADGVRLIAVSKTFPLDAVRAAYDAGQRDFGENRVQEAMQKIGQAADMDVTWHLIGHLQSNKARRVAEQFGWIHAVDSVDLLRRLDLAAAAANRTLEVLIQVDLALEPTKYGAPLEVVPDILSEAARCTAARVRGLMLLPPIADNPEDARPWFRRLREERDRLQASGVPGPRLRDLSMGMSHDFEVAIEEGATIVRVGTAIFGERH
jgi:pyridoxal phosphate enzyme (YggS family)